MGLPDLPSIPPGLAGGAAVSLVFVAVWFANWCRKQLTRADTRYNREAAAHEATKERDAAAHELTKKALEEERRLRLDAEARIRQLEWDVRVLKHELAAVKKRVVELEGNGA